MPGYFFQGFRLSRRGAWKNNWWFLRQALHSRNGTMGLAGPLPYPRRKGVVMVWKQDLAKLKKELQAESGPEPPKPPPARKPDKPSASRPLEEEDALFLQSMGKRPGPPPLPAAPFKANPEVTSNQKLTDEPDGFEKAMSEMKGIKPIDDPGLPPPLPDPPPVRNKRDESALNAVLMSQLLAASEETRPLDAPPPPKDALTPKGPVLIQLAAGMAVDLRNHTLSDARERLKERLEDSIFLGWRSIHVVLGPSEALRQGFLAFLTTPIAKAVQRYAQAPVPMGGSQAWILYLGTGQP